MSEIREVAERAVARAEEFGAPLGGIFAERAAAAIAAAKAALAANNERRGAAAESAADAAKATLIGANRRLQIMGDVARCACAYARGDDVMVMYYAQRLHENIDEANGLSREAPPTRRYLLCDEGGRVEAYLPTWGSVGEVERGGTVESSPKGDDRTLVNVVESMFSCAIAYARDRLTRGKHYDHPIARALEDAIASLSHVVSKEEE